MKVVSSPVTTQRVVLREIGEYTNSPAKRKIASGSDVQEDATHEIIANKRLRFGCENKESAVERETLGSKLIEIVRSITADKTLVDKQSDDVETQQPRPEEILADHPQSEATVTDPDLPSSGSEHAGKQSTPMPPTQAARPAVTLVDNATVRQAASNLKCRLQLAMYKLKSHKEDLSYKNLLPRQLISGKVEERTFESHHALRTHTSSATPKPVASNFSNERSLQRSSSGNDSITETPIRRHYSLNQDARARTQNNPMYPSGERLPDIVDASQSDSARLYNLPPISSLELKLTESGKAHTS